MISWFLLVPAQVPGLVSSFCFSFFSQERNVFPSWFPGSVWFRLGFRGLSPVFFSFWTGFLFHFDFLVPSSSGYASGVCFPTVFFFLRKKCRGGKFAEWQIIFLETLVLLFGVSLCWCNLWFVFANISGAGNPCVDITTDHLLTRCARYKQPWKHMIEHFDDGNMSPTQRRTALPFSFKTGVIE